MNIVSVSRSVVSAHKLRGRRYSSEGKQRGEREKEKEGKREDKENRWLSGRANAGDMGLIPGQGTKTPHAVGQPSPCTTTTELAFYSPGAATTEPTCCNY